MDQVGQLLQDIDQIERRLADTTLPPGRYPNRPR
jgi:hypothetical protein